MATPVYLISLHNTSLTLMSKQYAQSTDEAEALKMYDALRETPAARLPGAQMELIKIVPGESVEQVKINHQIT